MEFYKSTSADPDWLVNVAKFHGHLGPWLTVGALVGQDALRRLDTRGHWLIEVVCYLPPDKQRPAPTCMLDGLQASTGATMGKCNLRLDWAPDRLGNAWPMVSVVRPERDGVPAAGVLYRPRDSLTAILHNIDPKTLETISREIARQTADGLFDVQTLSSQELSTGKY